MVRRPRITTAIALAIALAFAPTLVGTAAADSAPLAQAEAAIAGSQGSTIVQPNPDKQTVPAGQSSGPCSEVCSGGAGSYARAPAVPSRPAVRIATHSDGFSWRDAGIGAGAVMSLFAIGLAGFRAATYNRRRRVSEQRAIATN